MEDVYIIDYCSNNCLSHVQILLQAGSAEAPISATKASNIAPPVSPTGAIQAMPMVPYWWAAFAVAQSVAAASQSTPRQMGENGAAPVQPDFNTIVAATLAALNSGTGMNPNMWMNMMPNMANMTNMANMANMGNKPQIPGMVAAPEQQQQQAPTLAHSAAWPTPTSESAPHKPAASLVGAPAQPQALRRSSSMTMNGHPHGTHGLPSSSPMKSGTLNVDMSRAQMNGKIPAGMPSNRGKYPTGLPNGGLTRSGSGMTQMSQMHASVDGMESTSTTLSLGLATHQSQSRQAEQMRKPATSLRFFPTIGNGVQGFLGPRVGAHQSEAAALATEARRRRRELKRTKSLQSQLQQEKKLASAKSL